MVAIGAKGYVRRRAKTQKKITVLGVFDFDPLFSCQFGFCQKKKGVGGAPKMR